MKLVLVMSVSLFLGSTSLAAKPDLLYECSEANGQDSDVRFSIDAKKSIQVGNTECSADMNLEKTANGKAEFKGVESDGGDLETCGNAAEIDSSVLKAGSPVKLTLRGGESGGNYVCRLNVFGTCLDEAHDAAFAVDRNAKKNSTWSADVASKGGKPFLAFVKQYAKGKRKQVVLYDLKIFDSQDSTEHYTAYGVALKAPTCEKIEVKELDKK